MQGILLDKTVTSKCLCSIFFKLPIKFKCFHFCYNFLSSLLWFILYLISSSIQNRSSTSILYRSLNLFLKLSFFIFYLFCISVHILYSLLPHLLLLIMLISFAPKSVFYFQGTAYGNVPVPSRRQLCESLNFSSVS